MDIRVPRSNLIRPVETSRLISRREPSSINHLWKPAGQSQQRNTDGANANGQLARAVNQALAPKPYSGSGMHPFKIYQLPSQYRGSAAPLSDPSSAWRTFRVRNGLILNTTIDPDSGPCGGSDQVDQEYYDVFVTQADGTIISGVTDIVCPDSEPSYYFWVDIMANSISYGADPTAPDHGSAWASFPTADANFQIIGWVDTDTLHDEGRALVRQVLTTDVQATGGGSAGIAVKRFKINTVAGNPDIYGEYFIGIDIDTAGTPLVRIAKNFKLRNSITSQVIDGTTWNYTYTTVVERTASAPSLSYSEYQRVSERYLINDYIIADNVGQTILSGATAMVSVADTISMTPGTPITWLDRNEDGRAWTAKADQSGP